MACICQYFVTSKNRKSAGIHSTNCSDTSLAVEHVLELMDSKDKSQSKKMEVSATELAAAKAEIWVLKKSLTEAQISIENLENLVKTIISKQNELMSEMYALRHQNMELQDECRMQRDYQTMERNAMMRDLHDIKTLLGGRTKLLEETVSKNTELTSALQDANEKIYMMGMKFLKLKSARSKHSSARSSCHSSSGNTERTERSG